MRKEIQTQLKGEKLKEVLEQLKRCPAGLDPALSRSISFGVAYHHAGLTFDERDIVEGNLILYIGYRESRGCVRAGAMGAISPVDF